MGEVPDVVTSDSEFFAWERPSRNEKYTVVRGSDGEPVFRAFAERPREWQLQVNIPGKAKYVINNLPSSGVCVRTADTLWRQHLSVRRLQLDMGAPACECGIPALFALTYKKSSSVFRPGIETVRACEVHIVAELLKLDGKIVAVSKLR